MTSSIRFLAGTLFCAALAQLQLTANASTFAGCHYRPVELTPPAVWQSTAAYGLLADGTTVAAPASAATQTPGYDPNSTNADAGLRGPITQTQLQTQTKTQSQTQAQTQTGIQSSAQTPTPSQSNNLNSPAGLTLPAIGPYEINTAGQSASSLSGLANITSVTATGTPLVHVPFDRERDPDLRFVQISLRNDSQQVAVINGDASQASLGSAVEPAVGGGYITHVGKPGLTRKKLVQATAVTLGSAGLAGPLFYEYITPGQHRDRSLGEAIGVDGTRHRVEAQRFGVRVLMPGDETIGWMAFVCEEGQSVQAVTIPLSFSRSLTPDGVLEVPIRLTATGPAASLQPLNTATNQQAAEAAIKDAQQSAVKSGAPRRTPGEASMLQDPTMTSTSTPADAASQPVTAPAAQPVVPSKPINP